MDTTTAALIGAGIGAVCGLTGTLASAFLSGWRQERVEANKRRWANEDAEARKLEDSINQLTVKLASAIHSMCWIAWIARAAPARLTQEQAATYDKEMHLILADIAGLLSTVGSLDTAAFDQVRNHTATVYRLDVAVARACSNIDADQSAAVTALDGLYREFLAFEEGLPVLMADVLKKLPHRTKRN